MALLTASNIFEDKMDPKLFLIPVTLLLSSFLWGHALAEEMQYRECCALRRQTWMKGKGKLTVLMTSQTSPGEISSTGTRPGFYLIY